MEFAMVPLLAYAFNTAQKRIDDYHEIVAQMGRINENKVALIMDMQVAFCNVVEENGPGSRRILTPRGILGRKFHGYLYDILSCLIEAQYNEDIHKFPDLPISLMNTQSKDTYAIMYRPFVGDEAMTSIAHSARMTHLMCCYVGDFLACVDQVLPLNRMAKFSAAMGDGKNMLDIMTALRHVPDYSHHFTNRPPRNGHGSKNKQREETPAPLHGLPEPGRA
jgi:hypothetical protein